MNVAAARHMSAKIAEPNTAPAPEGATSSVSAMAAATADSKPPYPSPAEVPTQEGPKGLRFDFNDGCRVVLPESEHPWRVRLSDLDTGNILFETELKAGRVNSTKRYYVRFRIEVWQQGERMFAHDYSAAGSRRADPVPGRHARRHAGLVSLRGEVPGAARLPADLRHGRAAHPAVPRRLSRHHLRHPRGGQAGALLRDLQHRAVLRRQGLRRTSRATSAIVGLHRTAGYILGVDPTEAPPRIALADDSRPIAEPYVCIAVQSTTQCKYWNNPTGWREIVALPEGGRLSRRLHRPEADARHRASSGTTSRTAPRTRPATSRWPSARAGSSTPTSSSACRAGCPGSPGRSARRW